MKSKNRKAGKMNELQTIPVSTAVSEINAFEIKIQEHEKELDFLPDMTTP